MKKVIAVLAAMIMIVACFAACDNGGDKETTKAAETTAEVGEETTAEVGEETTAEVSEETTAEVSEETTAEVGEETTAAAE